MSIDNMEDMLEHKLQKEHHELLKRDQTIKLLRIENDRLITLSKEQSVYISKYRELLKLNGIEPNE